jgi:hypothetical protein
MLSAFPKFILASVLMVAQVLSSVAVPASGQCASGSCSCSAEAKQTGSCCCRSKTLTDTPAAAGGCCHAAKAASSRSPRTCQCGCQSGSRPTMPTPRQRDVRDRVPPLADEAASVSQNCLLTPSERPAFDLTRSPNAFFADVPQQSLICAWLL